MCKCGFGLSGFPLVGLFHRAHLYDCDIVQEVIVLPKPVGLAKT